MSTMYDDVNAKCPFFLSSSDKRISCEGITEGCVTKIEFKSKEKRNRHRRKLCDAGYNKCEIYKMLEKKYEEENGGRKSENIQNQRCCNQRRV